MVVVLLLQEGAPFSVVLLPLLLLLQRGAALPVVVLLLLRYVLCQPGGRRTVIRASDTGQYQGVVPGLVLYAGRYTAYNLFLYVFI